MNYYTIKGRIILVPLYSRLTFPEDCYLKILILSDMTQDVYKL